MVSRSGSVRRAYRVPRSFMERATVTATLVVWGAFFMVLAVRQPRPPPMPEPVSLEPGAIPDEVPYIPAEDPSFVTDDIWGEVGADQAQPAKPAAALAQPANAPAQPAAAPLPSPPPSVPPGSSTGLSCFTARSSASQRSFSEPEKSVFRRLFDWAEKPTGSCKRLLKFGGAVTSAGCLKLGDRFACLDPPMRLATSKQCLVYAFSVQAEWSFAEAMVQLGCEVHAFSPRLDLPKQHQPAGVTFHQIGVGRNNHTNVNGWHIHTLDQVVRMLGHIGRPISYLQLDIEGSELDMLSQQLLDGSGEFVLDAVEQIGLDVHLRLDPRPEMDFYRTASRAVGLLRRVGFNVVQWDYNKVARQRFMFPGVERPVSLLYEILLVKNGPDTWDRSTRGQKSAAKPDVTANLVQT
ncbi:uncharacterized protein LOC119100613 [Pollicipes pollicipes]|uniref:uncharacterized protein LOC119100613 n=1 Tax=Pollicipes pollicipes TaxID=41117 RepID=UPI0018849EDB|nr:uncharacterized protein LOC119100613 [Pollicipes pollicipes]